MKFSKNTKKQNRGSLKSLFTGVLFLALTFPALGHAVSGGDFNISVDPKIPEGATITEYRESCAFQCKDDKKCIIECQTAAVNPPNPAGAALISGNDFNVKVNADENPPKVDTKILTTYVDPCGDGYCDVDAGECSSCPGDCRVIQCLRP